MIFRQFINCSARLQGGSNSVPFGNWLQSHSYSKGTFQIGKPGFFYARSPRTSALRDKDNIFLSLITDHCRYVSISRSKGKSCSSVSRRARACEGHEAAGAVGQPVLDLNLAMARAMGRPRALRALSQRASGTSHTRASREQLTEMKAVVGVSDLEFSNFQRAPRDHSRPCCLTRSPSPGVLKIVSRPRKKQLFSTGKQFLCGPRGDSSKGTREPQVV